MREVKDINNARQVRRQGKIGCDKQYKTSLAPNSNLFTYLNYILIESKSFGLHLK